MALSQLLDDSPRRGGPAELRLQEAYNERHRLALEELLSGGLDAFLGFLQRERIPNFLSDDEIQRIRSAAAAPPCACPPGGEDPALEASLSVDCSSVTYFPEVSDVEPPLLELGWPAFTAGSYRGVTRAVAHFQPSYGESIYSCKEAARRMIKSAREVIAIVTDSLTDVDVFKDLQEACSLRSVPVYILLDQACAPAFLKMCRNVGVGLDDLRQMRVRIITGTTYYMRSGARITGEVHERFMLIDGNRVATGSYRFNWTDGKLNSSNLIELSGQIAEKFDEEFRILYAQSLPINTRGPPSVRNSGIYEHLLIKPSVTSSPLLARDKEPLTSTPNGKTARTSATPPPRDPPSPGRLKASPPSDASTLGEDCEEEEQEEQQQQEEEEEILAGSTSRPLLAGHTQRSVCCHAATQTSRSVTDSDTQTDVQLTQHPAPPTLHTPHTPHTLHTPPALHSPPRQAVPTQAAGASFRDSFQQLSRERQQHFSSLRCRLELMVAALSTRGQLAHGPPVTQGSTAHSGRPSPHQDCGQEPNPRLLVESAGVGTWPRARCVH